MDLDDEWENFLNNDQDDGFCHNNEPEPTKSLYEHDMEKDENQEEAIPECSDIKISTKTKIIYLNTPIDLTDLFWKLQLIDYMERREGILKSKSSIILHQKKKSSLLKKSSKMKKTWM